MTSVTATRPPPGRNPFATPCPVGLSDVGLRGHIALYRALLGLTAGAASLSHIGEDVAEGLSTLLEEAKRRGMEVDEERTRNRRPGTP